MSKFQLIVTLAFGAFIVLGVIVFALSRGSTTLPQNKVLIWGTLPQTEFNKVLQDIPLATKQKYEVTYVEKSTADFDTQFVEALAEGKGPDIIFLSQDALWKNQNKVFPIPYSSFSERQFKDTFIQEGELYLTPGGILGLPVFVDPLVMYWNRDMFSNAGLSRPPQYWDEFFNLGTTLTKKDANLNITESALALGEFSNITHAKEILSTLVMQAGSPIATRTAKGVSVVFNERFDQPIVPAEAAVNFYTEFSNPVNVYYSWNRSLPRSDNFFSSGDLGIYFGFASELNQIKAKNPNVNFDVASFPQSRESKTKVTYGEIQALAIVKNSPNIASAVAVAAALVDKQHSAALSKISGLPPARRDLLSTPPTDASGSLFYQSALYAKGWIDPDSTATQNIMRNMIESITAGRSRTTEAVSRAQAEIQGLFGH